TRLLVVREERTTHGDRLRDEARCLEGACRVVRDFVALLGLRLLPVVHRVLAVPTEHLEVRRSALLVVAERVLAAALVGDLDELLRLEAEDVDLDLVERGALVRVLRRLVALAEELEELRNVLLHVVEARRLLELPAEDVDAFEIELRRVLRGVV